jgi:hypothetical protein
MVYHGFGVQAHQHTSSHQRFLPFNPLNKHKQLHDAVVSAPQPQSLLQLVRHFLPSTGQFGAI